MYLKYTRLLNYSKSTYCLKYVPVVFYAQNTNTGTVLDKTVKCNVSRTNVQFLPARCYASAGNSDRNVSVRPSVRHAPVLCQNEES